jgi:NAD(P)-dependent dehydrogenase (short-subunit alcohol dehydrogenase family)
MNSLKEKTVIITGPTSGIGKEIAFELGSLGAHLVLACRNTDLGKKTALEISGKTGNTAIEVMNIDTSSRTSIISFVEQFTEKYSRLDVLVNNAGINTGDNGKQFNENNIELTFATNVLGYFLLTRELTDALKAAAPSRIVNVASQFASDLDLDDLQFVRRLYDPIKAYAQSKACDRLLTWAFARRLEDSGVTANAMAPGLVTETGLYRNTPSEFMAGLRQRGGRTVAQGADTAVWLASSDEVQGVNGKLFELRKEVHCGFRNTEAEEKLWDICEKLLK